eukprot:4175574-Amphidinium_carterae.1
MAGHCLFVVFASARCADVMFGESLRWINLFSSRPRGMVERPPVHGRSGSCVGVWHNYQIRYLKPTLLIWCARFGLSREVRQNLGYHVVQGSRSALNVEDNCNQSEEQPAQHEGQTLVRHQRWQAVHRVRASDIQRLACDRLCVVGCDRWRLGRMSGQSVGPVLGGNWGVLLRAQPPVFPRSPSPVLAERA